MAATFLRSQRTPEREKLSLRLSTSRCAGEKVIRDLMLAMKNGGINLHHWGEKLTVETEFLSMSP